MCRMAWIEHPSQWEPQTLLSQLTYLNEVGGGKDKGSGVGWIDKETDEAKTIKEVEFKPSDALQVMIEKTDEAKSGFLYHSRIPSVGPVCDELCMPFNINNSLFCYNGTWTDWMDAYYALLGRGLTPPPPSRVSDALVAALLIEEIGLQYLELVDSGVVLLMTSERVILQKTYAGDFARGVIEGQTMLASALNPQLNWTSKQGFKKVEPYIIISDDIPSSCFTTYYSYTAYGQKTKPKRVKYVKKSPTVVAQYKESDKKKKKSEARVLLPAPQDIPDKEYYAGYIVNICIKDNIGLKPIEWSSIDGCDLLPYASIYNIRAYSSNDYIGIIPLLAENAVLLGTSSEVADGELVFYLDEFDHTWVRRKEWCLPVWVKVSPPAECYNPRDSLFDAEVALLQNTESEATLVRPVLSKGRFRLVEYMSEKVTATSFVKYCELYDRKVWATYCLITEAEQIPEFDPVRILSLNPLSAQDDDVDIMTLPLPEMQDVSDDSQLWECMNCEFVVVGPAGMCPQCDSYKWAPYINMFPPTIQVDETNLYVMAWKINQYNNESCLEDRCYPIN